MSNNVERFENYSTLLRDSIIFIFLTLIVDSAHTTKIVKKIMSIAYTKLSGLM